MFSTRQSLVNRIQSLRLTAARHMSRALAGTLFPPQCCLCGFPGASLDLDLCLFCRADLPWISEQSPGAHVPLHFEPPADEMIRQLKYGGAMENARVLGVLLAQSVRERGEVLPRLLVPVPLHNAKLRSRGFNQAGTLARYAGRLLDIPQLRHAVRRVRNTPSQTSLNMDGRHRNVRGAFAIGSESQRCRLLDAGHVAVVDDVITTGSTITEVKCVLLAAGVRRVDVWAVARAR